jgi:glycosyltransferase involved in cell wall biosynthesis
MQGKIRNLAHTERHFEPSYPVVTVVIATYNSAGTLRAALRSVLDQAYKNLELIVVDGGSTDGTVEILKQFDQYINLWVSETDRGVYDAMNKGIAYGSGDWYYFLGADDALCERFSRAIGHLTDPTTLYYGDVWMPERRIRYDGEFSPLKLALRNICHQSVFYPRLALNRHQYDLSYAVMADYALNLVCFGDKELRMEYIPETVAVFNDYRGLSQTHQDVTFAAEKLHLIWDNFPRGVYLAAVVWHWFLHLLKRLRLFKLAWRLRMALKKHLQHS